MQLNIKLEAPDDYQETLQVIFESENEQDPPVVRPLPCRMPPLPIPSLPLSLDWGLIHNFNKEADFFKKCLSEQEKELEPPKTPVSEPEPAIFTDKNGYTYWLRNRKTPSSENRELLLKCSTDTACGAFACMRNGDIIAAGEHAHLPGCPITYVVDVPAHSKPCRKRKSSNRTSSIGNKHKN